MPEIITCGMRVLLIILAALPAASAEGVAARCLDTLADTLVIKQGWGNTGINTAAWTNAAAPSRLRIGNTDYDRGLGHHAPGEIVVPLAGRYLAFTAEVGIQWQGGGKGSVGFEV